MTTSGDNAVTFGLILVSLFLLEQGCLGQRRSCSANSRPHPNGFCGEALAQVHQNLCLLLRQQYPDVFSRKRSLSSTLISKRDRDPVLENFLFSTRLDVLGNGNPTLNNTLADILSRGSASKEKVDTRDAANQARFSEGMMMDLLQGNRVKRQSGSSNLVCECCYNQCGPRDMAAYC